MALSLVQAAWLNIFQNFEMDWSAVHHSSVKSEMYISESISILRPIRETISQLLDILCILSKNSRGSSEASHIKAFAFDGESVDAWSGA
ncbi:hypothetical protein DM806_11600 [Sphingobium lactosutens]|nr:hypothetical protein [Sphingobium lactosutens]